MASTRAVFPHCSDFAELNPWTGMRPATPTGLPIVGRLPGAPRNLLFNTGHGALGFTLAFGSAGRIADALNEFTPSPLAQGSEWGAPISGSARRADSSACARAMRSLFQ